jgi:hypothetical protein
MGCASVAGMGSTWKTNDDRPAHGGRMSRDHVGCLTLGLVICFLILLGFVLTYLGRADAPVL